MISERKILEVCLREFIFVSQTLNKHVFYDKRDYCKNL